ncbi:hypothetical protein C8Q74DRAFT_662289 [Fomes fomentarius]|nr:hypothetical protein C8Q74DRAFT_662289 [Fomes fomentarius]
MSLSASILTVCCTYALWAHSTIVYGLVHLVFAFVWKPVLSVYDPTAIRSVLIRIWSASINAPHRLTSNIKNSVKHSIRYYPPHTYARRRTSSTTSRARYNALSAKGSVRTLVKLT